MATTQHLRPPGTTCPLSAMCYLNQRSTTGGWGLGVRGHTVFRICGCAGRRHLKAGVLPCYVGVLGVTPDCPPCCHLLLAELACMSRQAALDMAEGLETAVAARVLGVEAEHKIKCLQLQTELKEEIDLLNTEKRDLLEQLQQEIRQKEDLEKVSFESWQRGHCDLWEQVARPAGWLGCRSAQGSARSGLGECAPQAGPSFPPDEAELCLLLCLPPALRSWGHREGLEPGYLRGAFRPCPPVPPVVVPLSPGPPSYPVSSGLCLQQRFPVE